jgi:hypothetical protein
MPHHVRKSGLKSSHKRWAIVNQSTGLTVGYSDTKTKAALSAKIRDGKHRPPGR